MFPIWSPFSRSRGRSERLEPVGSSQGRSAQQLVGLTDFRRGLNNMIPMALLSILLTVAQMAVSGN